jgi:hypothetical protein
MSEPSYLKDTWCNIDSSAVSTGDTSELGMNKDSGFSFHCGSADDDDEVTESKIKAFLDDKVYTIWCDCITYWNCVALYALLG